MEVSLCGIRAVASEAWCCAPIKDGVPVRTVVIACLVPGLAKRRLISVVGKARADGVVLRPADLVERDDPGWLSLSAEAV